uniref:BTB domain-containing protein n=1 Tax=Strongyloides stercoralis TaxID=6248 RepID=A0A0K0DXK4_STRER
MDNSGNESICSLFKGEPLVESGELIRKCPYCGRDFSKYSMMRKQCHLEACQNSTKQNDIQQFKNGETKSSKNYIQTTLDCAIQNVSSSKKSKNTLNKNIKTVAQKSTKHVLNKSKSAISMNETNYQICSCPYNKNHIKERIAGLFTSSENISKENIDFSKEPFFSTKRLIHYEILARDFQKLTKRCSGDVTVKAKNGVLRWHKIILQIRTKFNIDDSIDLSKFEKESLLAYEKYIYGGEIRYSHHLLKDLKDLAQMYGPESLKHYLENDFIINEESDVNENYEIKRYNSALRLNEDSFIETSTKLPTINQDFPLDSFDETMDYAAFDVNTEYVEPQSHKPVSGENDNISLSEKITLNEDNLTNEIVNETIENSTNENINTSVKPDTLENHMVTQSQPYNISYNEMSPQQINNTCSDFENSNIGVIIFEDDDVVDNKATTSQSMLKDQSQEQNDMLNRSINTSAQFYPEESFCGIIEGGYYSSDSRCETPVNNVEKLINNKEKSPTWDIERKQLFDLEINKVAPEIYKTPNSSQTINCDNPKEEDNIKSKKQMIEEQLTKSSKLVKYTNITPRPAYEKMSDVELHKELAEYGIGKCGRKKAITMLDKIYNQLHPTIFFDNNVESPKGRKRKVHTSTKICLSDSHDNVISINDECSETNISANSLSLSQDEMNILEESCIQFPNSQEVDDETSTFGKGKKPKEISEWRSIFVDFIHLPENKVTFNRILSYSTFELSEIYQLVKSSTHSIKCISKSMLITILDELHISFTLPNDGWESKAKKRKK